MSTTTRSKRAHRKPAPPPQRWNKRALFITAVVVALLGSLITAMLLTSGSRQSSTARPAAPFTLTGTDGKTVSLADFKGKSVLIYFNEGAGCDACFYQQVDIEKRAAEFRDLGVTVLPIVMNPADQVLPDLARFKITTPYLIDSDGSVSQAYGVLGKGMHAGLPGHGFVLIDGDGVVKWQGEYPTMYLPADELIAKVKAGLS